MGAHPLSLWGLGEVDVDHDLRKHSRVWAAAPREPGSGHARTRKWGNGCKRKVTAVQHSSIMEGSMRVLVSEYRWLTWSAVSCELARCSLLTWRRRLWVLHAFSRASDV